MCTKHMRKFSDEERERIHEELVQTGRDLLLKFGPAKTTVKDITDPSWHRKTDVLPVFRGEIRSLCGDLGTRIR